MWQLWREGHAEAHLLITVSSHPTLGTILSSRVERSDTAVAVSESVQPQQQHPPSASFFLVVGRFKSSKLYQVSCSYHPPRALEVCWLGLQLRWIVVTAGVLGSEKYLTEWDAGTRKTTRFGSGGRGATQPQQQTSEGVLPRVRVRCGGDRCLRGALRARKLSRAKERM